MLKEVNLTGVYLSPFILYLLVACPVFLACRWGLMRTGLLARVWYPALFELCLFIVILFVLVCR